MKSLVRVSTVGFLLFTAITPRNSYGSKILPMEQSLNKVGLESCYNSPPGMRNTPRESEKEVYRSLAESGQCSVKEQVSYKGGEEVPYGTRGSTRPDVIVQGADGTKTAWESKNYNLNNFSQAKYIISKQIPKRRKELPADYQQSVVFDMRGQTIPKTPVRQKFSKSLSGATGGVSIFFMVNKD